MAKGKKHSVYQLKITLDGIKPPIWRQILISSHIDLEQLHDVIQEAMGWDDDHLHQFVSGRTGYGLPDDDFGIETEDEKKYKVSQILKKEKDKLMYEYDFGDSWEHSVVLEKILSADAEYKLPRCIKGKRACPPEDCGGIWGYKELLDIIQDPSHSEYQETIAWLGEEFDPERFDIDEVNRELDDIFEPVHEG